MRYGVPVEIARSDLVEELTRRSTVPLERSEHRHRHTSRTSPAGGAWAARRRSGATVGDGSASIHQIADKDDSRKLSPRA